MPTPTSSTAAVTRCSSMQLKIHLKLLSVLLGPTPLCHTPTLMMVMKMKLPQQPELGCDQALSGRGRGMWVPSKQMQIRKCVQTITGDRVATWHGGRKESQSAFGALLMCSAVVVVSFM